jgi:hypothetical protein
MKTLAIGPRTSAASWEWVGQTISRELTADFNISVFDTFDDVGNAELVLIIKQRPPAGFLAEALQRGSRPFFAPIDVYHDPREIAADAAMLGACEAVLLHSEALLPALLPYCRKIIPVEHHGRFILPALAPYRSDGFLLWLGAFEHLPYLLHWLNGHPCPLEVRLLTNLANRSSRIAGHFLAHELGIALRVTEGNINGFPAQEWSEAVQAEMMQACRAAIDIKGDSFNQRTKPPTKAQQFVASGVPFGCNPGHPAIAYFRERGFDLADAADVERLLSRSYWEKTQRLAVPLRETLSLAAINQTYRQALGAA